MDITSIQLYLTNHAVLLGTVVFVLLMMYLGFTAGLLSKLISLGSLVLTLVLEIKLFPIFMKYVSENEAIGDFFLGVARSLMNMDEEKVSSPLYSALGLNVMADNAADLIENLAAKIICFLLIFILVNILMRLISLLIGGLKRISVIDNFDKMLGTVFGLIEAIILLWVFMLVVAGLPNVPVCKTILEQIAENPLLDFFYSQNLLLQFAADLFG